MKFRWTVSLAALALVAGILPALAQQQTAQPKSKDRQKIDRKIDAAAATPFVTKHQADVLKGDLDKGEERKEDEKVAYPDQGPATGGTLPQAAPLGGKGTPFSDPNSPTAKGAEQPKADPPKPTYRLMGTVCGTGRDVALFDQGKDWPSMMKEGDMLDPTTKIVKIERGKVRLEHLDVTVVQQKQGDQVVQTKQEKKESYDLYAW